MKTEIMPFNFKQITFEEQLSTLKKAEEWLNSLDINVARTRFKRILDITQEIIEALKQGGVEALIDKHGNLVLWQALTDGTSFMRIYKAFGEEKSHIQPRGKLRKILEGSFLPWEENPQEHNVESRNILFELETAAALKGAGAAIVGFDDVDFEFKNRTFNVQCKRIYSSKRVRSNVGEAIRQLDGRTKKKPEAGGILCLCIDKLVGKEEMILKVKDEKEIRPEMGNICREFILDHENILPIIADAGVLGILLFCRVVSFIEKDGRNWLTTCRQIEVHLMPRKDSSRILDYEVVRELACRLGTSDT